MSAATFALWQDEARRWRALQAERNELLAMLHRFVDLDRNIRRFPDAYIEGRALVARIGEANTTKGGVGPPAPVEPSSRRPGLEVQPGTGAMDEIDAS